MREINIKPPRDACNHPHAKIVKHRLLDTLKTLAGKAVQEQSWIFNNTSSHKGCLSTYMRLSLGTAEEKFNKELLRPIVSGIELTEQDPNRREFFTKENKQWPMHAERAAIRVKPFFSRHQGEHYLQKDMRPMLGMDSVHEGVLKLLKDLSPYCLFKISSIAPDKFMDAKANAPLVYQGYLKSDALHVFIFLKDEMEHDGKYDLLASIHVISPTYALEQQKQATEWRKQPKPPETK